MKRIDRTGKKKVPVYAYETTPYGIRQNEKTGKWTVWQEWHDRQVTPDEYDTRDLANVELEKTARAHGNYKKRRLGYRWVDDPDYKPTEVPKASGGSIKKRADRRGQ